MWEGRQAASATASAEGEHDLFAIRWFRQRLNQVGCEVADLMLQFRLSEALKVIYSLIWDDFCSWYLEWVKPGFEQPIDQLIYQTTVDFFSELMLLLHPFMPFITEEIYHQLEERDDDICNKQIITYNGMEKDLLATGDLLKAAVTSLRDARNKQQLKPKEQIVLHVQAENENTYKTIEHLLVKQVNASSLNYTREAVAGSIGIVMGKDKFYIETTSPFDSSAQKENLVKELNHLQSFLIAIEKKLGNQQFLQNAKPDVLMMEQKKKSDAEVKIKLIGETLLTL